MRINRALGLALVIIILQFLVPRIFHAMEDATISLFHTSDSTFQSLEASVIKGGNFLPVPKIE